MNCFKG